MICFSDCLGESLPVSSFSTFSPFQTLLLPLASSQDTVNLKHKEAKWKRKTRLKLFWEAYLKHWKKSLRDFSCFSGVWTKPNCFF